MTKPVIKIENIGKKYNISHKQEDDERLLIKSIFNYKSKKNADDFWALKDVSFEVNQGDRFGIIGRNGAGKSTLLKILSRIVSPTTGRIEYEGRISSLLEVGTGFHPELTGRENIYLNGSILGMKKQEISKKFDEIVAFSEIEQFLETPVKRYSSGMYVRLAFGVAAHLDPDILVVDEVLAVGDSTFQKKCIGKMEEVSETQGRTILFVSHSMETVLRLCNKGILLDKGQIKLSGDIHDVTKAYLDTNTGISTFRTWDEKDAPENAISRLISVKVHDEKGEMKEKFDVTGKIAITMVYEVLKEGEVFTHSYNFYNENGINIFNTHDTVSEVRNEPRKKGIYTTTMWIPSNLLSEGVVLVGVAIIKIEPFTIILHEKECVSFTVIDHMRGDSARGNYTLGFPGAVRPLCQWETKFGQL
ncbi:MAG: ABC transporter ATP-binding protein [Sphingobacteriaceae bacterium]|nr:ABC transporter ATP-binding protein [Sphingobacteriaceae bacterium]